MVSERLMDVTQSCRGQCIKVTGQFRSYNRHEEQKNRLILSVFAREIEFVDEEPDGARTNHIMLEGYMCKRPVYRKTPLGREIADLLLAVNRPYGKSDYIPLHLLGAQCPVCLRVRCGRACPGAGTDPEPGVCEEAVGDRDGDADGLRGVGEQAGMHGRVIVKRISYVEIRSHI